MFSYVHDIARNVPVCPVKTQVKINLDYQVIEMVKLSSTVEFKYRDSDVGIRLQKPVLVNSCVSLVSLGAGLLLDSFVLVLGLGPPSRFPKPDERSERARQREGGREREKQNERLAAGVNCLSHQTDFLIP